MAQGLAFAGVQLDGQRLDRRGPARPQLRHEVLPAARFSTRCGSTASCTASCRCWRPAADTASASWSSTIAPASTAARSTACSRFVKGFLDLLTVKFLTGFGQRPQHVLGTIGLGAFLLGVAGMTYLTVYWVSSRICPGGSRCPCTSGRLLLYSVALMLLGGQLMSLGFLAELFVAYREPPVQAYSIAERTPDGRRGLRRRNAPLRRTHDRRTMP